MRRALVAAGIALMTAACGDGGGSDGLAQPGSPPASSEEVVCFDGSYAPSEEGATVPQDEVCREDEPSPTPASSPAPTAAPAWDPAAAFLSPEAAAQAEEPGWTVSLGYAPEAGPLLDPCGEGVFPRAHDVAASDEQAMSSTREAGGSGLAQEVFRYTSPEAAADALKTYADAVERCPEQQAPQSPEGYTNRFSVIEQTDVEGVRRLLVRRQPCTDQDQCTKHFRTYLFAAQTGDGVTVADYGIGEDGDPEDAARALLHAAAEQLGRAVTDP